MFDTYYLNPHTTVTVRDMTRTKVHQFDIMSTTARRHSSFPTVAAHTHKITQTHEHRLAESSHSLFKLLSTGTVLKLPSIQLLHQLDLTAARRVIGSTMKK